MSLSPEEIAARAAMLNYDGSMGYIGTEIQDDLLSFTGAGGAGNDSSLLSGPNGMRQYSFDVRNAADTTQIVALCAATFATKEELSNYLGFTVNRLFTVTGTADNITVTPNDSRITPSFLISHVRFNSTQLIQMTIGANDSRAWATTTLEVYRARPWQIAERIGAPLSLKQILDKYQQQNNKVDFLIDEYLPGAQFDDSTVIILRIGGKNVKPDASSGSGDGGITLDFQLDFGGSLSMSEGLRKKINKAKKTVQMSAVAQNYGRPFGKRR
jgi:hypothetical protein